MQEQEGDFCELLPQSPCSVREVEHLPGDKGKSHRVKTFQLSTTVTSLFSFLNLVQRLATRSSSDLSYVQSYPCPCVQVVACI